jgi:large exoprotein involved in heme utilization and adhesion
MLDDATFTTEVNSQGTGKGGNLSLTAQRLQIRNGGQISASTSNRGDAGNLTVQAAEVDISGTNAKGFRSGLFAGVAENATGRGGNLLMEVDRLTLREDSRITVANRGQGNAGNLTIKANTLVLDNRATILAETNSGQGGNLQIQARDLLLMRRGSGISTSAGLAGAGGNGGNITIAAPNAFLVTAPNENNDITANAFNGSGGRVAINAQGIYNFTIRSRAELSQLLGTNDPAELNPRRLPTNDISAISQNNPNLNGSVTLTTPDIDPSRGLLPLPTGLVDSSNQIAQECQPGGRQLANSFTVTGRGGLPISPIDPLMQQSALVNLVELPESGERTETRSQDSPQAAPQAEIVEAQGWTKDANGDIFLIAAVPTSHHPDILQPANCPNL